jgi:glycosyltransferase involved in cell wall biosynthesis
VTSPRVTVLMSVFNGQRYLREAIDSILAQTFKDFELLIIDDASTDDSSAILNAYHDARIRVITNERNRGLTASLNSGLTLANGELIARHDADDRSRPTRLAEQVAFLDEHPAVAVVGTQAAVIDENGRRRRALDTVRPVSPAAIRFALMTISPMVHGSVMFRRSVVRDELHGYDETFPTSQDVELWSRVAAKHPMQNLTRTLIDFRVHATSVTSTRYTRENVLRVEEVLRRGVIAMTGDVALANEWAPLWVALVNHAVIDEPEQPERAVTIVDALRRKFLEREPDARRDRGVASTYGMVQLIVASYLARRNRGAAGGAAARAMSAAPTAAFRALPRLAAAAALPRAAYARVRAHRKGNR